MLRNCALEDRESAWLLRRSCYRLGQHRFVATSDSGVTSGRDRYERAVRQSSKELLFDQRLKQFMTGRGVHLPESSGLRGRQLQTGHFPVLAADALKKEFEDST